MNFINYYIAKIFLKIKFVNMINIINDKEIIPELIQDDCNPDEILNSVYYFLKKPELIDQQLSCERKVNPPKQNTLFVTCVVSEIVVLDANTTFFVVSMSFLNFSPKSHAEPL